VYLELRLDAEMVNDLQRIAATESISVEDLIRKAIWDYLARVS
jgi:predicted transcriptional regulator